MTQGMEDRAKGAGKWTPGPWSTTGERLTMIDRRTYEIARVRESGYVDGISIVAGARLPDPFPLMQGIHNAHLIAAAAEMYEALKLLLQHSGIADAAPEDKDGEDHQAEHAARASLRKARGELPATERSGLHE